MPLPPVKPRSSPRSPAATSGRKSVAKAVAPVGAGAAPKELSATIANEFNRAEETARDKILRHEQIGISALAIAHQQAVYAALVACAGSMTGTFGAAAATFGEHNELAKAVKAELATQATATSELNNRLNGFIDFSNGDTTRKLRDLEQRCAVLTRELELKTAEADTLAADNKSLTHTISQRLIKSDLQFSDLRQRVSDAIEQNRIDFQAVRQQLYQRIDTAVLQYHKPQFDTAVQDIRNYQTDVGRDILEHTRRLTHVIDEIGSSGVTIEAKSLHSQIPAKTRTALAGFTKEQLLNLMDVLSFEEGVVAAVARGVAAHESADKRAVFR